MRAPVAIKDFARVVLPFGSDGELCMLTAYFDDSGTHAGSDVVLWGGFFGNQYQWEYLSEAWQKKLNEPVPGKPPLSRFHMTECQARDGEFAGWKRIETDFLVHELGEIILKSGIYADSCAVSRKDWDQLILGDLRKSLGDAEGYCLRSCYLRALDWAREHTSDNQIAFVFDNRLESQKENEWIFGAYKRLTEAYSASPELVSLTFASSRKFLPLQAADMLAWEFYTHSNDLLSGRMLLGGHRRKQLKRLLGGGRIRAGYASRASIEKIAKFDTDPGMLARLARLMEQPFPHPRRKKPSSLAGRSSRRRD